MYKYSTQVTESEFGQQQIIQAQLYGILLPDNIITVLKQWKDHHLHVLVLQVILKYDVRNKLHLQLKCP